MGEVAWTQEAERWLQEIHDYIAKDSVAAAERTVEGIYRKVQLLREFPRLGCRYEHEHAGEIRIASPI